MNTKSRPRSPQDMIVKWQRKGLFLAFAQIVSFATETPRKREYEEGTASQYNWTWITDRFAYLKDEARLALGQAGTSRTHDDRALLAYREGHGAGLPFGEGRRPPFRQVREAHQVARDVVECLATLQPHWVEEDITHELPRFLWPQFPPDKDPPKRIIEIIDRRLTLPSDHASSNFEALQAARDQYRRLRMQLELRFQKGLPIHSFATAESRMRSKSSPPLRVQFSTDDLRTRVFHLLKILMLPDYAIRVCKCGKCDALFFDDGGHYSRMKRLPPRCERCRSR